MYTSEFNSQALLDITGEVDLSSTANLREVVVLTSCKMRRLHALGSVVTVGATVIKVYKRPTPRSTSGQVLLGTINIPAATAVGKDTYLDISPVDLKVGQSVAFTITTAATSGKAVFGMEGELDPEMPANQSNMTATT